jgi:membrane associated rhomboid family serine protease
MGLSDRHYARPGPTNDGLFQQARGLRPRWSVTTWIIVICVAVFVIDGFLPKQLVQSGYRTFTLPSNVQIDPDQVVVVRQDPVQVMHPHAKRATFGLPLVDRNTGMVVGWAEVFPMKPLQGLLYYSTQRAFLNYEFWRFIGFQFLHANMMHIVFNMLGLFFFGPMVEAHLGGKRFLAFYILCGMFGALMFLLLNMLGWVVASFTGSWDSVPQFLFPDIFTPLIGASAGVYGVILAGAYLAPDSIVYLFFVLPMRLQTLAYGLVGIALFAVFVSGSNAGGEAAHLGGAVAGYYFIRHPHHLHGFFDILGRVDPTSHHYRRKTAPASVSRAAQPRLSRHETRAVDRVLDKISREGLRSLTEEEKRILRERDGSRKP